MPDFSQLSHFSSIIPHQPKSLTQNFGKSLDRFAKKGKENHECVSNLCMYDHNYSNLVLAKKQLKLNPFGRNGLKFMAKYFTVLKSCVANQREEAWYKD